MTLAKDLAFLVEETSNFEEEKPKTRMELKRIFELRIKKRVKEQYRDGKFHCLLSEVIANPKTLRDAYDSIRVNSNVVLASEGDKLPFDSMANELSRGEFDVSGNTYCVSTRGRVRESLVFPNIKLMVIKEAIRIVLEVVYRPHFSKISHGGRSGRGHWSALRYVCKEIHDPDWWFTPILNKKLDDRILDGLLLYMESKIEDPDFYAIIRNMFDAHVLNLEFGGFPKGHGLPQEGVLSPILMNIYLNQFDHEIYRMSMKYEALDGRAHTEKEAPFSKLRSWFRGQINGSSTATEKNGVKIHCCRVMDEILVAISGPKEVAISLRNDIQDYLNKSLLLETADRTDVLSCISPHGIRFLGILVKRTQKESAAVRAVHKLKKKVGMFLSQKQDAWDEGTGQIGKKWLAHGLKKVKESEIKHLADKNSLLSQISRFRKPGMKTDHWYKDLLKIWMQDIDVRDAASEEYMLSKHISEPALPSELRDSFYEFQKRAEEYIASETASTLALLPNSDSLQESIFSTKISAPVNDIMKRLHRYGLTNLEGYPRTCHMLILQDANQIIDWFSGIASTWIRWYNECDNFNEVKAIISNQLRMSCIRTLAAKYRTHESKIEEKFETELSKISSIEEIEFEIINESLNSEFPDLDDALFYGISYSGISLLSLARVVSHSRPCSCFVIGCETPAPCVYALNVMERQKFPVWKTGFPSCIHPSLHRRRIGLCKKHLQDLVLGHISLQAIDFGVWR
ncbi:hypothetical protein LIER_30120 [Lithospermum erythrorhizon]